MTAREAVHGALRVFRSGGDYRGELERSKITDVRDRALANQITLGVVRNLTLIDYYIRSASSIRLKKIEPPALDILRSAVYQLAFLDKVPKSAAVNEAVALARKKLNPRAVGFINAVLRKLSDGELPEVKAESEAERLSILCSHPLWLVQDFIGRIGEAETEKLLRANNTEPPVYARVNTLKITEETLLQKLTDCGLDAQSSGFDGTLELRGVGDITSLESFENGEFFVQDPSSTHSALALGARPGDRVIDACAAPGGKSFATAIAMQNKGEIISFDAEKKVRLISDGARRLGIDIISARAGDSSVFLPELECSADAVLVDAPCSGYGVIRKKPEIRYKAQEDIAHLPKQARDILSCCASYVKPGGTLVYSTCTLLTCENEEVVSAFLDGRNDFEGLSQQTLWPHIDGTDGFFVAVLKRKN